MRYIDYCCIQELSLSGGREIVRRTVGNQISEMVRLMRTEKKHLMVKSQEWDLRPERLEDTRITMKNLGENSRCARSGPTPLQQDCVFQIWKSTARCNKTVYVSFRSEDSRCGATPLLLPRDWVRVNRYIDILLYPRTEPLWSARTRT